MAFFPGFESRWFEVGDTKIYGVIGGKGPPLLLLHGYPQTHVMWDRVAALLAAKFTVVATDLRGYGQSGKPASAPDHSTYSKRSMAADQVRVMASLGFNQFGVAGHDRGGRVAHRMALDHARQVTRWAALDIVPTLTMYQRTDRVFAEAYYHWFFLIQPAPLPERLIGADPDFFLMWHLTNRWGASEVFDPAALAAYRAAFRDPATIHATCEDYRAAASIDLVHDQADLDHRVTAPLLALWGRRGVVDRCFRPLDDWRERVTTVTGESLDCGHYLAEEAPNETARLLLDFFG